ncbi:stage II sporulation protein E [Ruminococcus flavefaciens]|uniref:Stage II sporulation protein E n=1 Tax=Ruminococcus flavefaciens TaxID=1265 RepID=A0A1H6JV80_RUMFL|nr:SpoIIE family protein phosphatase [Ruminococcus flavefaciens]SEH66555.1 stage II sporulation protein E [Ruminococcus flavefaciens]
MINIKKLREWQHFSFAYFFAVCAAAGFVLSGAKVGGVASFADISLAGAVGLPYSAAVFTGSMVRCIISGTVGRNIVKLSASALIVIIKMFLEPKNDEKLCGINTGVSVLISGAAVSAVIGELPQKLLFYAFYGALAGFTAYSAARFIMDLKHKKVIDVSDSGGFSCAVVYIVAVSSLCGADVPVVNVGVVVGAAVTLMGAYFYGQAGGVICGALTVCGAFLSSFEAGMGIVLLPASGLLTGYMRRQKPFTAAAFFAGIGFVFTVLTGLTVNSVGGIIDIICAAGIFIPAASVFSDKWIRTDGKDTSLTDMINTRMSFLSETVGELRRESERVSQMLAKSCDTVNEIEENSAEVCSLCYRRPFCWKSDKGNTYRGFAKLAEMGEFAQESFPQELADCLHKEKITEVFLKSAREKAAAKLMEMRFSESRELLHEQMLITEDIIRSTSDKLDIRCSETVGRSIRLKLEKFGFVILSVIAYYNSRSRLIAEVYFKAENAPENGTRICDLIADELHLQMSCTELIRSGNEMRIRVYERPRYSMEAYVSSSCADNSAANGDTYTVFTDGAGMGYVVLSDGMGTGKNAAMESRMAAGLFRRLVSSGVSVASTVKLINSFMVTKSREESFATLDVLCADLDDGRLTVIKSGAAATLIRHGGNVLKITAPTFPIGIYEHSELFARECEFEAGDIVIMFSDGISENAYPFIKELLMGGDDIKHIVDEICTKAYVFNQTIHSDDVTVIAFRLKE